MTAAPRVWVGAAALAVATLPACDGGTPVQRGFGSRQLLQVRDPSFAFAGSRGDLALYTVGTDPTTMSYLSVDLRTGDVATHDSMYSDVPTPYYFSFSADPSGRYRCSYGVDDAGNAEFRIDDAQTGARTEIAGGEMPSRCPTGDDPTLMIWRFDGTGPLTLWTGRYDDLQMAPVDLVTKQVLQDFGSGATTVSVLASRPAQPDALGIYSIDLTTFAVTAVVPPALDGGAWADGTTPAGSGDSASLFADPNSIWNGVFPIGDHFGYWRAMADGSVTMFVGPLASGPARELALFRRDASSLTDGALLSTSGTYLGPSAGLVTWQRWAPCAGGPCGASDLLIWDDARRRLSTCPSAFVSSAAGVLSDDHDRLAAFVVQNPNNSSGVLSLPTGPLLLVDLTAPSGDSTACTTVRAGDVSVAGFAPDGSSLFWLVHEPYPATSAQLYLAAPDGSAPRLVGDDLIEGPPHAPHFVGPSQLEVDIDASLVWIDTHDDPTVTHPIVDRARGGAIDRGRWLIIGYDSSQQDGTAHLGVVNRDTGDKRLISPDVNQFFSPDIADYPDNVLPAPARAAGDPLRIVYLVRGRNPSPQDGVWVASIYPSDIP